MGPAATTALGVLAGLIVFLAMAMLGTIAVNGSAEPGIASAEASAAAGGGTADTRDLNGDGFLSLAEASGDEQVVTRFNRADRNRDGKLSEAEFKRLEKLKPAKPIDPAAVRRSVRRDATTLARSGG